MEYYSEIRRPTSWTHTVTWIDLMILLLMLSEKNLIGYFYIIPFLGHCCCLVDKSCLTLCNPMDRFPWWATVHEVAKELGHD